MGTKKVEDGIRAFLDSLGQIGKPVVDKEAVKALKTQIRQEGDAINKVKLLAELEREEEGRAPDFSGERAVFVAEAKAWAEDEGVTVSAFQALGVPDEVLREAGFTVSASGTSTKARRSSSGRAPRMPLEDVLAAAKKLGSGWKLGDLAAALDRDTATVRNYVNKLVQDGSVKDMGEDPEHDGRGRAPKLYSAK